jgi:hypothetical protein
VSGEERWRGPVALGPLLVPLESLTLDPENARRHPRANIEAIKSSLLAFGQRKPVVYGAGGMVIAGNGTVEAARELGWTSLAAVDSSDLSADEARAYGLADNQTTDLSEWEAQKLRDALSKLPEAARASTGFSVDAIAALSKMTLPLPPSTPRGQEGKVDTGGSRGILVTTEQGEVIDRAVEKLRAQEGDPAMTVGRALELLCAEYLS